MTPRAVDVASTILSSESCECASCRAHFIARNHALIIVSGQHVKASQSLRWASSSCTQNSADEYHHVKMPFDATSRNNSMSTWLPLRSICWSLMDRRFKWSSLSARYYLHHHRQTQVRQALPRKVIFLPVFGVTFITGGGFAHERSRHNSTVWAEGDSCWSSHLYNWCPSFSNRYLAFRCFAEAAVHFVSSCMKLGKVRNADEENDKQALWEE